MMTPDSHTRPSAAELLCTSAFQAQDSSLPSFSPLLAQPGRLFEESMEEAMEEAEADHLQ